MSVCLSYALHAAVLGWIKGTNMDPAPTGLKIALLTAGPNPDGTGVVEPLTQSGYARQAISFGALTTDAGVSSITNAAPVVFGAATADWSTVTHAALFTTDGAMLAYGPLPATRTCKTGDSISFGAATVQLRLK